MKLGIVCASIDLARSWDCRESWRHEALAPVAYYLVRTGEALKDTPPRWYQSADGDAARWEYTAKDIIGVVPAYAIGVQKALEDGCDVIAALHDDLLCETQGWDLLVRDHFDQHPRCGLLGFGGALGLGAADIYQTPYNPMQLARQTFGSRMRHAEAHGQRWEAARRVACLDGFAQVGRREFWEGYQVPPSPVGIPEWDHAPEPIEYLAQPRPRLNLFQVLEGEGVRHHAYDSILGAWAYRLGWETWFLPIQVHHLGGQTAVADARYAEWAKTQDQEGDAGFWLKAHQYAYENLRDVLPIRIQP